MGKGVVAVTVNVISLERPVAFCTLNRNAPGVMARPFTDAGITMLLKIVPPAEEGTPVVTVACPLGNMTTKVLSVAVKPVPFTWTDVPIGPEAGETDETTTCAFAVRVVAETAADCPESLPAASRAETV